MNGCEPNSHIVESQCYSGGYTPPETRKMFCDRYRHQRWLDVEASLALAAAAPEIIPAWAA